MAARLRSRLSFARREAVREQETEPGTPVTGQVSGLLSRHDPSVKGGVNLDHFGGAKVDQLVKG